LRDYAGNKRFRRDLFARGTAAMTAIVAPYQVTQSLRRRACDYRWHRILPAPQAPCYRHSSPKLHVGGADEFWGIENSFQGRFCAVAGPT